MTTLFHRNPRLLAVTVLLILVAGTSAAMLLPRMEDPRFANRNAQIVTRLPGADAERVEALVTRKIEEEIQTIPEIRKISSSSRAGVSIVSVELQDTVGFDEVDAVWSLVRDKVDDAKPELPVEATDPDFDNDKTFAHTMIAAIVWSSDAPVSYGILNRLAEQLEDDLRAVPGTEYTEVHGHADEEILVELDPDRLAALGLTAADIAARVAQSDAKVAAGQLRSSSRDFIVEVTGELDTLDRVANVAVQPGRSGQVLKLGDIATIRKDVEDPPANTALIDGRPGVAVAARMAPDERIDVWAAEARARVAAFTAANGGGVDVRLIFDQSAYTNARLTGLVRNFAIAVAAVIAVVFLFMGWRSALLVGSALPLTVLMVLTWMRAWDVPIHQMSITGLIIALGLLIDNAIVVVDELNRRLRAGDSAVAAIDGSVRHLAGPLLGSTLTTVFAFMPIVLMPGGAGEFVGTIALGVILSLICSLALSLTIIPAITARIVRGGASSERAWWQRGLSSRSLRQRLERSLDWILARPALGIVLALTLPVLGFAQSRHLVEQFFPPADRDQFQLQVRFPDGTSIERSRQAVARAGALMTAHDNVEHVHWFLGESAPLFYYNMTAGENDASGFAQALVDLNDAGTGTETIHDVQRALEVALPSAEVIALQLEQGPPFAAPIELKITGPDADVLRALGDEARAILAGVPDVIATRTTLRDGRPQLAVRLDDDAARLAGLDNRAVAAQIDGSLEGALGGSLLEATEELPVRVRLSGTHRSSVDDVASLDLFAAAGDPVPLSAVGELALEPTVAVIDRENGERINRVFGFVTAGVLPGQVLATYEARLAASGFVLPDGYGLAWGGEAGERDRAVGNLMGSVAVLAVLMAAALVLSFRSFRLAGVIGVVAAASAGLGLGALWIFGMPFGFMAIVGIMGLIGVAINDSIVVLAALREDEAARAGDRRAVRRVVVRASRHVLATTVTTVAGFMPLMLAGGGFWPPLVVTIAGGVVGATLLALLMVPSAYVLLMRPRSARANAGATEEPLTTPAPVLA